jgi:hypothetical protein
MLLAAGMGLCWRLCRRCYRDVEHGQGVITMLFASDPLSGLDHPGALQGWVVNPLAWYSSAA